MNEFKIEKYTPYFHDGTIHDIKSTKNKIIIAMESAELRPEWNEDGVELSKNNTISGNLYLENFGKIHINDQIYKAELVKTYDSGDIYTFEIYPKKVLLLISWINYPPKPREETPFSKYEIEAENIYWENMPDIFQNVT